MKSYVITGFILICGMMIACNNASESIETKDSTNIRSTPDNTINADTATIGDTASYERMHHKSSDSTGRY